MTWLVREVEIVIGDYVEETKEQGKEKIIILKF